MGVLYNSSIPSQCNVYHDSFCIVDDRSCASFSTRHRSAYYSGTALRLYHSFLLVICRVGHVHNTSRHWLLQGNGDEVKTLERSKKAEHKSDGTLALSGKMTTRRWPASCGAGTRKSEDLTPIHHSRDGAREQPLDELAPGDAGHTGGKPVPKPASLADDRSATHANPWVDSIKTRGIAESRQEEQKFSVCALEDCINAADVPLPPSPPPLTLNDDSNRGEHVLDSVAGRCENRPRDDSHEDVTEIPVCSKKVKRRLQNVIVNERQPDAKTMLSAVLAEPKYSLPKFEVPRKNRAIEFDRAPLTDIVGWLDIDCQTLTSTCFNFQRDPHDGVQTSLGISTVHSAIPPAPLSFTFATQPILGETRPQTDSFVSAIRKFNELVGSCNASARFAENAGLCLANNRFGTRCRSNFGMRNEDRPLVGKLLTELTGLDFNSNPTSCVYKLLTFTNLAVCNYQRKSIREKVAGLRQRQVERTNDKDCVKYLPHLLPYRPPESDNLRVNEFILKQANEPFTVNYDPEKELGEGYLYVYWNEATFGVRKIGFTTYQVSDRLRQWEAECKHAAVKQYSSPSKVRHAERVEQLVHADLLDYRVREPACRTCFKSHIEWFRDVDLPYIIGRIEAWSQWASEGPYEKVGGQWCLTSKGRDKMPIVTDPFSGRTSEVHVKQRAHDPRRYDLRFTKSCVRPKAGLKIVGDEDQKLAPDAYTLNDNDAVLPSLAPMKGFQSFVWRHL